MNRVLQGAGCCIRSPKERGVVIFLDMRFAWPNYMQCLPREEWGIRVIHRASDCFTLIEDFFKDEER